MVPRFLRCCSGWHVARLPVAARTHTQVNTMASTTTLDSAHKAVDGRLLTIPADPYDFEIDLTRCALLIIDMQRDFLEPGGFGEMLGNDVSQLRRRSSRTGAAAGVARGGTCRSSTRAKVIGRISAICRRRRRCAAAAPTTIGDAGPMGRILVRGEAGHDIIPELYPLPAEPVIDKPGKGAFFATDLHAILQNRGITQLVVTGVTTEVCVNTTVREANDRGYDCCVPEDCVGSYFPEFQRMGLKMIKAQGGIFGWVSHSDSSPRRARRPTITPGSDHDDHTTASCGCPATGTRSSASAPTSSSTCSR